MMEKLIMMRIGNEIAHRLSGEEKERLPDSMMKLVHLLEIEDKKRNPINPIERDVAEPEMIATDDALGG